MIQETGEGIGGFLLRLADGSPHSLHSWRVIHRAGTLDGGKDGCNRPKLALLPIYLHQNEEVSNTNMYTCKEKCTKQNKAQ